MPVPFSPRNASLSPRSSSKETSPTIGVSGAYPTDRWRARRKVRPPIRAASNRKATDGAVLGRALETLDARELRPAALGLPGILAGDVAADVLLLLLDEVLLLFERPRRREDPFRLLPPVGGVAAGIRGDPPGLELDDALRDTVQEAAVVGDDEVGALGAGQVLLEELHGLEVEVVGRLVEKEHVRGRQDRAGEHRPVLLPAGQLGQRALEIRLLETEAGQRLVHLGDHLVAALVLEPVRERVVPVVKRRGMVPVRHRVLHAPQVAFDCVEMGEGARRIVVDGFRKIRRQGLVHGGDPDGGRLQELSGVRLFPPQGDPQEGRLPGPVAADQADLLPRVVLPGDLPQHFLGPVALVDGVESIEHEGDSSVAVTNVLTVQPTGFCQYCRHEEPAAALERPRRTPP